MKVSELIAQLQQMPQGAPVVIDNGCGCAASIVRSVKVAEGYGKAFHSGVENGEDIVISGDLIP